MNRVSNTNYAAALLMALAAAPAAAADTATPAADSAQHVGAATCAGASCHGASHPAANSRIQQNEFFVWERDDAHAGAYRALTSERGKHIAAALHLADAAAAPRCLGCHTDAVPPPRQGRRYRLAEGVSCEACHGGAEHWLASHSSGDRKHADNVAAGLYPLSEPFARARVCLQCHYGTEEHPVDHALMAAGHPPLSFELDTYSAIQPAHFRTGEAHQQWKAEPSSASTWVAGQLVASEFVLDSLAAESFGAPGPGTGVFPELAFFDCNACHHRPTSPRWSPELGAGKPGHAQVYSAPMDMTVQILGVLSAGARDAWRQELKALHGSHSPAEVRRHAAALTAQLKSATAQLAAKPLDAAAALALLRQVAEAGRAQAGDMTFAEQTAMALGALANQLVQERKRGGRELKGAIDAVFAAVKHRDSYDPARFRAAVTRLDDEASRQFANKS